MRLCTETDKLRKVRIRSFVGLSALPSQWLVRKGERDWPVIWADEGSARPWLCTPDLVLLGEGKAEDMDLHARHDLSVLVWM